MKMIGALLFLVLFMTACDAPRDRSTSYRKRSIDGFSSNNYSYNNSYDNRRVPSGATADPVTDPAATEDANSVQIPSEISHCSWSQDGVSGFASNHPHLGDHTLCQSSTNKNDIWIQVKSPITDAQLCLLPTHNNGSSSVFIGEPRCLILNDSKRIYKVTLFSNRSGFQNASINSVMVMKDVRVFFGHPYNRYMLNVDAYMDCSDYLARTGNPAFCDAFKQVGRYVFKNF